MLSKLYKQIRHILLLADIFLGVITIIASGAGDDGDGNSETPSPVYSISGTVSGNIVQGITVILSGNSTETTMTDTDGNYSFRDLANGSYIVTPFYVGNSFSPASIAITIDNTDAIAINFTGSILASLTYLSKIQDQFHLAFNVYTDAYAAGNHFSARGMMGTAPPMQEDWPVAPHSGNTAIRCEFDSSVSWGGWYMMNGILQDSDSNPRENWGDTGDAGVDLQGAKKLIFWAKGEEGGEEVEFYALGVGRDVDTGVAIKAYPDSSAKISTGTVILSTEWTQYAISLTDCDLSYVLGGFAWVTTAENNNYEDIVFYLDDIVYDKARTTEPRFLVSYETKAGTNSFDVMMRNVAFTYDNAVALIAFLSAGENNRAKLIADSLVYAQNNDRYFTDGRLRNAYQGGDLASPPGWIPNGKSRTIRMPGWTDADKNTWLEDAYQVGSDTGNIAWAMLALLTYYDISNDDIYLSSAIKMGDWIESDCRDTRGAGGYTAGYYGWETNQTKHLYKSTEHNIDLYAVFQRLFLITGDIEWRDRAEAAKQFVISMWDGTEGKFWSGTGNDGETINTNLYQVPLKVQAWAVLSLDDEGVSYWKALTYVEKNMAVYNEDKSEILGFDFNNDLDGVWFEGTVQMTAAYYHTAQKGKADNYMSMLNTIQLTTGAMEATSKESITTGFQLADGSEWLYYRRPHVGVTAWLLLAEDRTNPFWL